MSITTNGADRPAGAVAGGSRWTPVVPTRAALDAPAIGSDTRCEPSDPDADTVAGTIPQPRGGRR